MASTIILITGANSGIGYASAKILAQASASYHIIMAGRSLDKLSAAHLELSAVPGIQGTLSTLQLDVTSDASISSAVESVASQFGHLDVLVHNAGICGRNLPNPSSIRDEFQLVLATNVTGPAVVAASFRPLLQKSSNPYSIYVSSGERTLLRNAMQRTREMKAVMKTAGAYQVSKAALNMLAVMEARDFGPGSGEEDDGGGIKGFAMSPGFVRSNLRGMSEEEVSGWGRAWDPEDSGRLLLSIVRGGRDGDVGCLVHKDGVFPW